MNIALYIAKRYLVSKSSQNAVNIINMVTFLVTVIGAAALFIVLSAFAGLKTFSLSFANDFDPDLKALAATGKYFVLHPDKEKELKAINGVAAYSKEIEERVFLTHEQKNYVAWVKGVDEYYREVVKVDTLLYIGNWFGSDPYQVVSGFTIAQQLNTGPNRYGSPVEILAPKPGEGSITGATKPYNVLPVTLSGVYAINEELDKKYIFANLAVVQPLLEKDSTQITGINFKLDPTADMEVVSSEIKSVLGDNITMKTRAQLNDALYKMLNTENLVIYLIFTLVLIIALFNVVGAIIMMILDKRSNLKTLFSLGVPVKKLRRIYFLQGLLVTSVGGILGILLAALLVWSQLVFQWIRLTPSLPYPVEFQLGNVLIVFATIFVLGMIASKIASARINRSLLQL
ncbi:ABC transporter permease [Robertkochia marina]|uniref:ABC transporter permease n=1 Tax=Robertkochia marina TaxID=1227945 RepID=A0A4S3M332_9FLAO|nr:FtsX-like permease family protein [Robertkochia marina]THD69290.1 ABC transporter permease [Robertkochia marina]TRZ47451.1 ABC transporter permease [Robertkochia marina]